MSRVLEWDGCGNVRDLGGHPLEQGGNTRFGVVIRADNVRRLTPTGWETLLEQGVRRVVDLRWHEELAEDPPIDVPVEVMHVPIFGMHRLETRYVRFAELARTNGRRGPTLSGVCTAHTWTSTRAHSRMRWLPSPPRTGRWWSIARAERTGPDWSRR